MKIFTELSAVNGGNSDYTGYSPSRISEIQADLVKNILELDKGHSQESAHYIVDIVFTKNVLTRCKNDGGNGKGIWDFCERQAEDIVTDAMRIASNTTYLLDYCRSFSCSHLL